MSRLVQARTQKFKSQLEFTVMRYPKIKKAIKYPGTYPRFQTLKSEFLFCSNKLVLDSKLGPNLFSKLRERIHVFDIQ